MLRKHQNYRRSLSIDDNCSHYCSSSHINNTMKQSSTMINDDCLLLIMKQLSMMEKLKCRLVCKQWQSLIDQILSGQNSLEILSLNSSLIADVRRKSGWFKNNSKDHVIDHCQIDYNDDNNDKIYYNQQEYESPKLSTSFKKLKLPRFFDYLLEKWNKLNDNLITVEPIENEFIGNDDNNNDNESNNENNDQIVHNIDSKFYLWSNSIDYNNNYDMNQYNNSNYNYDYDESKSSSSSSSSMLNNITELISIHYYWNYIYYSTSSLFSSFIMFKSKLSQSNHSYSHLFCYCRCRQRYKYTILIEPNEFSTQCMKLFLRKLSNIDHLQLNNLNQLNEIILLLIMINCNDQKSIDHTQNYDKTSKIFNRNHRLKHLSFINCHQQQQQPQKQHQTEQMSPESMADFDYLFRLHRLNQFSNNDCDDIDDIDNLNDYNNRTDANNNNINENYSENCQKYSINPDNFFIDYSWKLLSHLYPSLQSLTLRQCNLNEQQLTIIIRYCQTLKYLDILDNQAIGKSVRYLGDSIECLICGNLSIDAESIDQILSNIAFGNGRMLRYLSIFGQLQGSLRVFEEFSQLSELELHFQSDDDHVQSSTWLSDIGLLSLNSLILEQIRTYECPSLLNHEQFEQMLKKSKNLQRLQILGDFDWNLRLNDSSLQLLSEECQQLKELTLMGTSSITDYGLLHLRKLPLSQLSLASFTSITSYSLITLIQQIPTLSTIILVDMPHLTDCIIDKTIDYCSKHVDRTIDLTFSDEKIHQRIVRKNCKNQKNKDNSRKCPKNLRINFNKHICGKHVIGSEPNDLQMILLIVISTLILTMTLLTTIVVVFVPLSMLLLMFNDYLNDNLYIFKLINYDSIMDKLSVIYDDYRTKTI